LMRMHQEVWQGHFGGFALARGALHVVTIDAAGIY
jgi:hypothetical protein